MSEKSLKNVKHGNVKQIG